ncbi:MAG: decarboxylating NADP(+)-dependent phosphogluconate dehydrogenase, partial [Oligoflexales bacterium]|nr:decarboxylating NADP(+)-dependent phosphogluconate dehydrogenase [Oligoflexales bacterium]
VDRFIEELVPELEPFDIIIDGGNSHFEDTKRRMDTLEKAGLRFLGTGISGGELGALNGPSMMVGGTLSAWNEVKPVFQAVSAKARDGLPCCDFISEGGAGHFVKMVHNGIEYADMQLISEIYHLMNRLLGISACEAGSVFENWNRGHLNSYLIQITSDILKYKDEDGHPLVEKILDVAGQKGTGKWTVKTALDLGTPLTLISDSVFARNLSAGRDQRIRNSKILRGPKDVAPADRDTFIKDLENALYASKIISYAQGFLLLRSAASRFGWKLNLSSIALIWREGCIIKSAFLDKIASAYKSNADLEDLLQDEFFKNEIGAAQESLRRVVGAGVMGGIPAGCLASALSYYDAIRSERLPMNLIQAQRDYFGAHMYERIDRDRGVFFHTDWTGIGGKTSSTAYSV